ncbi:MAG: Ig-like domain-containing protein [Planctomycetota bacterium]
MTLSPNRKFRSRLGRKTASKKAISRLLRMESLERRELMASDVSPFHNTLAPADVDGDFQISPLDALNVINAINSQGTGSLSNRATPNNRKGMIDVDGDNILSPLDALGVINSVNRGEGVGELVEVKYQFFALNADGTVGANLDPNPNDTVSEASVSTGQKFVVRTLMTDLRSTNASGVFSAYEDFNYTNADGTPAEKIELQWSEYNGLKFTLTPAVPGGPLGLLSGNFKIRYGSDVTASIAIANRTNGTVNPTTTARNIQTAIEALPGIGVGNVVVSVNTIDPSPGHNFDIYFRNSKARTNIPDATLEAVNLTVSSGTVTQSISSQASPDPTDSVVARGAFNYAPVIPAPPNNPDDPISPQITRYGNGPAGYLDNAAVSSGKRTIRLMGGFADTLSYNGTPTYQTVIMDTAFVATVPGKVNLLGSVTILPDQGTSGDKVGIALYGATNAYLQSSQVLMVPASITINDRLTATPDSFTIAEDAAQTSFNVVANDVDKFGTARGIVSVTQPTVGGTVAIGTGTNPQNILFTPAKDYFGPVVFTYTIRNNVTPTPDQATGTVTINVTPVNDAPVVIGTNFSVSEDPASTFFLPASVFSPGPANESDQTVTFTSIVTAPTSGTATILGDGTLQYSPATDFFGTVTLVVRGTDNGSPALSTNATLTIAVTAVNDAPRIVGTSFSVAEDPASPLVIPVNQLFTPGPANESSQTVTLAISSGPTIVSGPAAGAGTASIQPGGALQFSPAKDFFGTVTLVLVGTDNGSPALSTTSTITITVNSVNDAPIAVADTGNARFVAIGLPSIQSSLDVMRNDSPGPFEEPPVDFIRIVPFTTSTTALGGTVTLNEDRTRVLYTPPAEKFTQVDSFDYTIVDSFGLKASAKAEVFLAPPQLPYAIDDNFVGEEDSVNNPFSIDVLSNDLFNTGFTKSLVGITTQPGADQGTASVASDKVVYTAPQDYNGTTSVVYQMTDSKDITKTSLGTVFIRITEVNDAPIAVNQIYAGQEDTTTLIAGPTITTNLSRGAPNEANQTLTVTEATLLTSGAGTVTLTPNGDVQFVPTKDYFGDVLVRYTVRDNGTTNGVLDPKTGTATLTISVVPVNDFPVTVNKTLPTGESVTREDEQFTFSTDAVIKGDLPGPSNENNQTVTFVNLTGPVTTSRGGTITQSGNLLTYVPAKDFNGADTFTYQVTDNGDPALKSTGTVTILVSEVNDPPIADDVSGNAFAGVTTVIDLKDKLAAMSRGAANENGQTLTIVSVTPIQPFVGTLTLNPNGTSVTYTAPLDTDTTVNFDFVVRDNGTTVGQLDPLQDTGRYALRVLPFIPSSIKGRLYIDDNNNGSIDTNGNGKQTELPVGGVEVTLSYADPTNPAKFITTTEMTEADGSYDFELLPPGTYTVSYVNPVSMIDSTNTVRSRTVTIDPPGDKNLVFDFPVLGINPSYGSSIEYLASSFYLKDATLRSRGMYAIVNPTGYTEWTSKKDGFEGDLFHEVVLSNDGSRAYLTAVRGEDQVFTATLIEKKQYIRIPAGNGNQLVRILASSSDLVWTPVNIQTPPITAKGYLVSVDQFFEQEGWM